MTTPTGSFDTTSLSDALDHFGIEGQALSIRPLSPTMRVVGRAFTVRLVPTTGRGGTVRDFIDDVPAGAVVVLDNGGRTDATVWGDLLTLAAVQRRVAGTVIHGVCRDTISILGLAYPMFSRGSCMRTGKDRVAVEHIGGMVSLGGASVAAQDLVVGDADGVVVVPQRHEEAVLARMQTIVEAEDRIRHALTGGASLRDARTVHGYHHLQRRGEPR